MPATKNAMTRYALIDRMLANRHKAYSIQDITDSLAQLLPEYGQPPVSKRCVEKDLYYLQYDSPFGVEMEEYHLLSADKNDRTYRKRCIRYADPSFSIFTPKLTEEEKMVLTSALDTLGSFEGLDNFEWLGDLQTRLNLERHTPIVSISKNLNNDSNLFARLFTAIRYHQAINLDYLPFQRATGTHVSITPHLLKEYNNRWFVIGSASDTGRLLTFAIDRIQDFTVNYELKPAKPPEDLLERYEEIIGVTFDEGKPLTEIIFWVSDLQRKYISTKPLHGSQTEIQGELQSQLRQQFPTLRSGSFFKLICRENYELIRELTSYGPELIALFPESIRQQVSHRISTMQRLYSLIASSNRE